MIKIHWFAYARMLLLGFLVAELLKDAGYSEAVVLSLMVLLGVFYPETVIERVEVPKDDNQV